MYRIFLGMLGLGVHEVLASGRVNTMRQMSVFKNMSTQVDVCQTVLKVSMDIHFQMSN